MRIETILISVWTVGIVLSYFSGLFFPGLSWDSDEDLAWTLGISGTLSSLCLWYTNPRCLGFSRVPTPSPGPGWPVDSASFRPSCSVAWELSLGSGEAVTALTLHAGLIAQRSLCFVAWNVLMFWTLLFRVFCLLLWLSQVAEYIWSLST